MAIRKIKSQFNNDLNLRSIRTPDNRGLLLDISKFSPDISLIIYLKNELFKDDIDYIYLFDTKKETFEITHLEKLYPYLEVIKEHLNLFIYCRFHVPHDTYYLDKVYNCGADSINLWCNTYLKNIDIIRYAANLWSSGTVLFDVDLNENVHLVKKKITQLTSMNIIPILQNKDDQSPERLIELYSYLNNSIITNKINLLWLIHFPITSDPFISDILENSKSSNKPKSNFVSKKLVLGYSNLRRKLIVKKVCESLDSAGL